MTVPMTSSEMTMGRLAGDVSGGWKLENAAAAASDLTLERVTFKAKSLVAIVKSSVELFEDANTIETTIEQSLGAALALELDRAALRGSGLAGEPLGILGQTGVTITGTIGSPADYVKFADTPTRTLREANAAEPYAFIAAPRTFESLDKLTTGIAGDKTRLAPPPAWNAYQRFSTNQIPINLGVGTNESEAYVGDFAQLMIGMRTRLAIEVSRQAGDATGSAFGNLQVWIRAYLRADIQLAHPSHFNVLTGILA
jgi:HK97 family phage major capsid protein